MRARRGRGDVHLFGGAYLGALPHYRGAGHEPGMGAELVEAVRGADGIIIAAPGYHGTVSGLVKNALDYLEDLAATRGPIWMGARWA
jgi:FMN reductase